jgi:hypothetical protein
MKLDWFTGKRVEPLAPALSVPGLSVGGKPVSDHDPIMVTIRRLVD